MPFHINKSLITLSVTLAVTLSFSLPALSATYIYDDLNRLQQVIVDNGHLLDYQYDSAGNPTQKVYQKLGIVVVTSAGAYSSTDTDRVVFFDASASACFERYIDQQTQSVITLDKECTFSIDFGGPGTLVGGNGVDIWVHEYDNPGTYEAMITVKLVENPSVNDIQTLSVSALEVAIPIPPINFTTMVNGNDVTLSAAFPAEVVSVDVFWGDRESVLGVSPANFNMNHTYSRGGRSYNIRVATHDAEGNAIDYTFIEDADLTVPIP